MKSSQIQQETGNKMQIFKVVGKDNVETFINLEMIVQAFYFPEQSLITLSILNTNEPILIKGEAAKHLRNKLAFSSRK